jgi:nucleotide-binding universal stress UspA family protein
VESSGFTNGTALRRILAPLDLVPLGEAKLPVTEEYARALHAEVILLHVLPSGALDPVVVSKQEAEARTYLDTVAAHLGSAGVQVRTLVRTGGVAATIADQAQLEGVDLIVLGSNVRRGLTSVLGTSIADQVVRDARCPILLVQPTLEAGGKPALRSFDEDAQRAGALTRRPLGLRTVEMSRIVGSVGRARDFGPDFRPLHPSKSYTSRYQRIKDALAHGIALPPVELYRLGFGYYVLDGHHRVAAGLESGQLEIEGNVTEFLPLSDSAAARTFAERRAFERSTGLTDIGARRPETYPEIAALIAAYQREHGYADYKQAAQRWYGEVFRPLWERVRRLRLSGLYPGERTADIIGRLGAWWTEQGAEGSPDWDEALRHFQSTPEVSQPSS